MHQKTNLKINASSIQIDDVLIEFKYPIQDSFLLEDMIFICIDPPAKIIYNQNVFGISLTEKKIKWQIEEQTSKEINCPYTGFLSYKNNSKIGLFNWCGFTLIVNPVTGEILEKGESK